MRILFADDDRELGLAVSTLLQREGYHVDTVQNGLDAIDQAEEEPYDCLILDWMMPEASGITVLQTLRQEGIATPCLMLTARAEVEDRVKGLDAGADDYLPKPFNTAELLARLRALVRRHDRAVSETIRCGDLEMDKGSMEVRCKGVPMKLTNKAWRILEMMMGSPRQVFTIEQITDRVWGWENDTEMNVLYVTISQLRRKLAEMGSCVKISAVRGVGYTLEDGQNG